MHAHKLYATISEDHRLTVELHDDFPPGRAEVIVLAAPVERKIVKLGGVLRGNAPVIPEGEDPIAEALEELREERREREAFR